MVFLNRGDPMRINPVRPVYGVPAVPKVQKTGQEGSVQKPFEAEVRRKEEERNQPIIRELINREKEVIAHEQAHKSVGGQYAGAMTYSYTIGPDGRRYISGGEVAINIPATDDPEQMEQALERVKQAALAPANPSPQDQAVAASAAARQQQVRAEIAKMRVDEAIGKQGVEANGSQETGGQGPQADQGLETTDHQETHGDHGYLDIII